MPEGQRIGDFRVVKRKKELFKGYPYYAAIDLPKYAYSWYLRADGTISHECNDNGIKVCENSGWFATMEDVLAAIAKYEAKKGVAKCG